MAMELEELTYGNPRAQWPVLLVIVGGLGDWCIRRVLQHAMEFETQQAGNVFVVVVDLFPREGECSDFDDWINVIDRWLVRRLIEQAAEDLDAPLREKSGRAVKGIAWGFTERLARDPELPDPTRGATPNADEAIEEFVSKLGPVFKGAYEQDRGALKDEAERRLSEYLAALESGADAARLMKLSARWGFERRFESFAEFKAAIIEHFVGQVIKQAEKTRRRLEDDRRRIREWLRESIALPRLDVHRYWRFNTERERLEYYASRPAEGAGTAEADDEMLRALAEGYRIIVYVATPPEQYPRILKHWSPYAERIALEKPIAGLLEPV